MKELQPPFINEELIKDEAFIAQELSEQSLTILKSPFLSDQRIHLSNLLFNYSQSLRPLRQSSSIEESRAVRQRKANAITYIAHRYGLLTHGESHDFGLYSKEPLLQNQPSKYATYEELIQLTPQWKKPILISVTGDPPHRDHAALFHELREHSDALLVGVDKNSLVARRKGTPNDPRPRFPQLAWRLWEIASLPSVTKVFIMPTLTNSQEEHITIFQQLGITLIGMGVQNTVKEIFIERIKAAGRRDVQENFNNSYSSTLLVEYAKSIPGLWDEWHAEANKRDAIAREAGYLHDYPDGT